MLKNMQEIIQQLSSKITYKHWLIIAGVISCVLGVLVYLSLGNKEQEKNVAQQSQIKTVRVLAARETIQPRTIIKERMLTVVELPENAVPEGALFDVKDVNNNPAAIIIMKGDIITRQKIMSDPKMAGFTGTIPAECRAVSIGISDVTGVAGFAVPGDYVDIMVVSGKREDGRLIGKLLLQNVLLLGINKSGGGADEKPANEADKNGDGTLKASRESLATATLALTPKDALQLVTTAQNGILYLTLRPYKPRSMFVAPRDYVLNTRSAGEPMRNPYTNKLSPRPAVPQTGSPEYSGGSGSVEVIRGTAVTREGGR